MINRLRFAKQMSRARRAVPATTAFVCAPMMLVPAMATVGSWPFASIEAVYRRAFEEAQRAVTRRRMAYRWN